jgi:hypothetical protein
VYHINREEIKYFFARQGEKRKKPSRRGLSGLRLTVISAKAGIQDLRMMAAEL